MDDIRWQTDEASDRIKSHQAKLSNRENRIREIDRMIEQLEGRRTKLFIEREKLKRQVMGQSYRFQNSHEHT